MKRLNRKRGFDGTSAHAKGGSHGSNGGSSWAKNSQGARLNQMHAAAGRSMPAEKVAAWHQQETADRMRGFAQLTPEDGPQIGW
jgi:hypothetical protein